MKPKFSEFSYGFALTHEICRRKTGALRAAPVFPSLIEEGRADGGHDMYLDLPGIPLFLQFKISEYMVRPSAGEWEHFNREYYRFWLHAPRHSDQHQLLLDRDQAPNVVYYAAPAFRAAEDLNRAFLNGTIVENSMFFRPRDIGTLPDADEHPIAFLPNATHGLRCSDPKRVDVAAKGMQVEGILEIELSSERLVNSPKEYFADLSAELEELGKRKAGLSKESERVAQRFSEPSQRAAFLARTLLGAELLWLTRGAEQQPAG